MHQSWFSINFMRRERYIGGFKLNIKWHVLLPKVST
jgi:hypothetical protein